MNEQEILLRIEELLRNEIENRKNFCALIGAFNRQKYRLLPDADSNDTTVIEAVFAKLFENALNGSTADIKVIIEIERLILQNDTYKNEQEARNLPQWQQSAVYESVLKDIEVYGG